MPKYLFALALFVFSFFTGRIALAQAPFTALQVQATTVAGCTTQNSNKCFVTLNWQHQFVDTNYSVVCMAIEDVNQQPPPNGNFFSTVGYTLTVPLRYLTPTQATVVFSTFDSPQYPGNPATLPGVHCIAVHE